MISVCIYSLREALRTVQKSFNIPMYGTHHTTPDMKNEILLIAEKLKEERVQEYVADRPSSAQVEPFRGDQMILENVGVQGETIAAESESTEDNKDEEDQLEDYIPSVEDLAMDDEEPIELADELLDATLSLLED
ncbi:hypothetical protein EV361DRAFT_187796 [Lentinula raphanica]|nr:hypothetical protein EV361DRAFT_187796 [Lentinula raphanica]